MKLSVINEAARIKIKSVWSNAVKDVMKTYIMIKLSCIIHKDYKTRRKKKIVIVR